VAEHIQLLAHDLLVWVGFGTIVGLIAKAIIPGKDQGGALATILMGIGGAVIGFGVLSYFWEGRHVTPLSFTGFFVAVAGAMVLLFFHRLLSGTFMREGGRWRLPRWPGMRGRRRPVVVVKE
jgi:uncharacterized membrane protein YeaQ/YmgE (transglycosylase-associated protein family)